MACGVCMAASIIVRRRGFQGLLIGDFWLDWCGACEELRPGDWSCVVARRKERKRKKKKKKKVISGEGKMWPIEN